MPKCDFNNVAEQLCCVGVWWLLLNRLLPKFTRAYYHLFYTKMIRISCHTGNVGPRTWDAYRWAPGLQNV